jgi:hypothetical protein
MIDPVVRRRSEDRSMRVPSISSTSAEAIGAGSVSLVDDEQVGVSISRFERLYRVARLWGEHHHRTVRRSGNVSSLCPTRRPR